MEGRRVVVSIMLLPVGRGSTAEEPVSRARMDVDEQVCLGRLSHRAAAFA